jgi:PAS domain-containing protein
MSLDPWGEIVNHLRAIPLFDFVSLDELFRIAALGRPCLPYLDTLEFLEVNQAAIDHYGYSREEFQTMTIRDIRPTEDVAGAPGNSQADSGASSARAEDIGSESISKPGRRIWRDFDIRGQLLAG